ncbi:MAG TPA: sensor domain-containing diguanylate cyclase [Candidatus Saccharimonadales bacterium]|nr:sensor domain-containing diguanylate cyclase [Candidatus Saccharimonadales bacterium]
MKARNGRGARGLFEASTHFLKSQQRMVKLLSTRGCLAGKEAEGATLKLEKLMDEKRPAQCLGECTKINERLITALKKQDKPGAGETPELALLLKMSRVIQETDDPQAVFRGVLGLLKQLVAFENGSLYLVDRNSRILSLAYQDGERVDLIRGVRFEHGYGFSSWVAKERRPVLLNDLRREAQPGLPVVRSFLSVPLQVGSELIGVVNLSHSCAHAFAERDKELLILASSLAAATIEHVLHYQSVKEMAVTDDLTSVYNRRYFQERLQQQAQLSERYLHPYSLVFIDIDHFKQFNDAHGHAAGDQVLAELGRLLKRWARTSDVVVRYGGDEFVVLLPHTDLDGALLAAERLRSSIEAHPFPRRRRITVSLGVASYPRDGKAREDLVHKADQALYLAKRSGRNCIQSLQPVPPPGADAPRMN